MMCLFANESRGQFTPCSVGTEKAADLLVPAKRDKDLIEGISQAMADAPIGGLGKAAPNPIRCVMKYFPKEVE